MRRRELALVAGLVALVSLPGPAMAASAVDQTNYETHVVSFLGKDIAQTVTMGQTGKLTGVDLFLLEAQGANETVAIYSLARATGLPTGSPMASATVMVHEGWYHFEFATPVGFIANGKFAIVLTQGTYGVAYGSSNTYAGGRALAYNSGWVDYNGDPLLDLAFRTYVDTTVAAVATPTPEPAVTPAPTEPPTPVPASEPVASASLAPDLTASPSPSVPAARASASGSATAATQTGQQSGGSGGLPGLIIFLIVVLAAVLGGTIGFALGRRPRRNPEAPESSATGT